MNIEIKKRVISALIFGFFGLISSCVAYRCRFFRLGSSALSSSIPIRYSLVGFFSYLIIIFFSSPVVFNLLGLVFPNLKNDWLDFPLARIAIGQLFTSFNLIVFLLLFTLAQPKGICKIFLFGVNQKNTLSSSLANWVFGMATWLLVFPIVGCLYETASLITYAISGSFGQDQPIVIVLREFTSFPRLLTIMLTSILIVAPIIEEIVFRGILQNYFKSKIKVKWAVIFSSLIFVLPHLSFSQKWGNIPLGISLFILSLFLGWVYERQGSILAPIALHMTFNSINVMRIFKTSI